MERSVFPDGKEPFASLVYNFTGTSGLGDTEGDSESDADLDGLLLTEELGEPETLADGL